MCAHAGMCVCARARARGGSGAERGEEAGGHASCQADGVEMARVGCGVFAGFRVLGQFSGHVPHVLRYHGRHREFYLATAVGRSVHTYNVSTRPALPRSFHRPAARQDSGWPWAASPPFLLCAERRPPVVVLGGERGCPRKGREAAGYRGQGGCARLSRG